jgi:hypothetical protein
MSAEYDDLPEPVKKEVQAFTDVNVTWLSKVLGLFLPRKVKSELAPFSRPFPVHN